MYDKINTNNQLMDNLIYYLKKLSLDSVLKDEIQANNSETVKSLKDADLYISCLENKAQLNSFVKIPIDILYKSNVPSDVIYEWSLSPTKILKEYEDVVIKNMSNFIIDNYSEDNDYYRMLNGMPNKDDMINIYAESDITGIDSKKPIHQMSDTEINILEGSGEMDRIKDEYPDKKYLNFLGSKKISPYRARKAQKFELIYCPNIDDQLVRNRYMEIVEKNRIYTLKTIYSEAFKYNSDYYDNFISLFIVIQSVADMVIELPETVIKRNFFDDDSIRDMFVSHGIDYFPEIPRRYQLSMIKNLNNLLKFKSTTKNIVDICSIFGFNNIEIFKYYLLKDRKTDMYGDYVDTKYKEVDGNIIEDDTKNYELKFIKVPVRKMADDYIRDNTNHIPYSDIVNTDDYWYGEKPKEDIDNIILNTNFNYVLSKYLSIDTIYDMSKLSFDVAYFFNMIFDNKALEENLILHVHKLSYNRKFKLTDIICFMYMLIYERIGIEDTILDTSSKVLHVMGFNFKADLSSISSYLLEKGYTLSDLGIDGFIIPKSDILSYEDLVSIYINNKNIYNHVVDQMNNADNIRIYNIYKKIYESMMVSELNTSIFTDKEGVFTPTYTEYIKDRDDILYKTINEIRDMDESDKYNKISELLDDIILSLEEYLDIEDFDFFIDNVSNISSELVKEYIYKLINFFKSHTVQMISMNTIYTFDNKNQNKILVLDDIFMSSVYNGKSTSRYNQPHRIWFTNKEIIKKDTIRPTDAIFIFRE